MSLSASLDPSSSDTPTNACLTELKVRARLGLHELQDGGTAFLDRAQAVCGVPMPMPVGQAWKLRHALNLAARGVGFRTWEQARTVLGGRAKPGDDMGSFWHAPRCETLLNHWYADLALARTHLARHPDATLLPYRRQFVVVTNVYLEGLGMDVTQWSDPACRDMVAAYGSERWLALSEARLRLPAQHWVPRRR